MVLHIHSLIQWQDEAAQARIERVLRLEPASDAVMTIDLDDARALPRLHSFRELEDAIVAGEMMLLDHDPYAALRRSDAELARQYGPTRWAKHRQRRDMRWSVIEPIVLALEDTLFDSYHLGPLVRKAHDETNHSKTHIYQYLRWYWQRGECRNALLPRYDRCGPVREHRRARGAKWGRPRSAVRISGAAPGINIDAQIREYFRRGTRMFYEQRDRFSLARAFRKIEERFFNAGYTYNGDGLRIPTLLPIEQRPTLRQYRYWFQTEWDPVRTGISREGIRRFNLRHRAVLGDYRASLGIIGPGSIYQIDATVGDVYLVSELERKVIGRPVIYLITDVFSTLITGFNVGLDGPSWAGAMLALENMTLDKVAYCAEHGITITPEAWPSHHLPRRLCADRGEVLSASADTLTASFNITVSNTAAYRPDWKGRIERDFRLINEGCLQWIPGHTNGWDERGERDCRLDACMSLREFTQYLIDFIVEYNTLHQVTDELFTPEMIRDGVEPYPNELWHWGIENRSGVLRTEPRSVVQRNLLPIATATVTREGIRFRRLHFMCERAREEHWIERARLRGMWSVPILYDPRTPKRIYVLRDRPDERNMRSDPEPCALTARVERFAACTWADVEHHYALRLLESQARAEYTRPSSIEHEARREAWIAEAERKTHMAQDTRGYEGKITRVRGARERRQTERMIDHARSEWTLGLDVEPVEQTTEMATEIETDETSRVQEMAKVRAVSEANLFALLRPPELGALDDLSITDTITHEGDE